MKVQLSDLGKAHAPIFDYCRALIAKGLDPSTKLEVFRGSTLAMTIKGIGVGAKLTVNDNNYGTPIFRRWKPFKMPDK